MAQSVGGCPVTCGAGAMRAVNPSRGRRIRLLVLAHTNRSPGARSVAINLLRVLATRFDDIDLTAVVPTGCDYEQIAGLLSARAIWFDQKGSLARRLLFDQIVLPRQVRSIRPDVILALGTIGMRKPGAPQAILVQDPHFVYPSRHHGRMTMLQNLRYFVQRRQVRHCLDQIAMVYGQTSTMLKRVRDAFQPGVPGNLLPKAISVNVARSLNDTSAPPEFAPFGQCFRMICLARYYPHKNLEGIVEVFRHFRKELHGAVVFITIAPSQHPGARRLLTSIERWGLSRQIVNIGPVEQSRIPSLFGHCHALFQPTLMESFSAAYLEAMVLNLPVLTSDLYFAHEICGPAALYFDPWSPDSMMKAIVRIRENADLRQSLLCAARLRLAETHNYSWPDIADTLIADLRRVVSRQAANTKGVQTA